MTARNIIKQWFSNFKKPTQEQFWAWIDSFWHKDDKIPISSVENLETFLQNTTTSDQFSNHLSDTQAHQSLFETKVDKEQGKGLSTEDFTTELKQKLENLQNADLTPYLEKGGYTGTAQDLKNLIENILTILNSDDTELDQLQEIVNYIKQNKQILDTLSVTNIAGLQDALNSKADTNHTHSYNDLTDKPTLFSGNYYDLTGKPDIRQFFDENVGELRNIGDSEIIHFYLTNNPTGYGRERSFSISDYDMNIHRTENIASFKPSSIEFNKPIEDKIGILHSSMVDPLITIENNGVLDIKRKTSYSEYALVRADGFMLPDGKKWLLLGDGTSIRMADFFRQKVSDSEARVSYNDIIRPRATGMYMMENNQDLLLEFNPQERKTRLQILYTPDGEDIKIRKFSPNTVSNEFKTIAFKEDLPLPESKKGIVISSNRYNLLSSNSGKTHFVMNPCVIDLSQLEDLESVTFKKCYNEMNSTRFEARGRTLIVRDNIQTHSSSDLNGLEGSYAKVSRVGQKIYINLMIYLPQHMLSPTGSGNVGSPTIVTSQPVRG